MALNDQYDDPPRPKAPIPKTVTQAQSGAIRSLPITKQLEGQLSYAARNNGVRVEVYSGGQDPHGVEGKTRTGSHRHDEGNSADIRLYDTTDGHKLDMTNPQDQKRMAGFVTDVVKAGATGVGAGETYMGPNGIHVGGGSAAAWGGPKARSADAPPWLKQAHADGMSSRMTPQQLADATSKLDQTRPAVTSTEATQPPGKPLSQTLTGGAPTQDQTFSLAPTSEQKPSMASAPAQQAITAATTPKATPASAAPPTFDTMAPTSNPLPKGIPVTGGTWRGVSQRYGTELPPEAVLSNAPGMVPTPRERPAGAGPNANAIAAENKAYGRGATAAPAQAAPQQQAQAPTAAAPAWPSGGAPSMSGYNPAAIMERRDGSLDTVPPPVAGASNQATPPPWPSGGAPSMGSGDSPTLEYTDPTKRAGFSQVPAPPFQPQQAPQQAQAPASAPAQRAPAQAPAGKSLGQRIIEGYGPRGQNLRAIVDPATGHEYVTGSVDGENINRDVGPLSRQTPARQAPAQPARAPATSPPATGTRAPTGPVPPAPEAAGVLAKPDTMASPYQTLDALDASRKRPNTLTELYGSQTPPTNPPAPGATFSDIANAGPGYFGPPSGTTLQGMGVPPYNVGGPGGTPLPPTRPGRGDLGPPNLLNPTGPQATGPETQTRELARAAEANYAPPPAPPGRQALGRRLGIEVPPTQPPTEIGPSSYDLRQATRPRDDTSGTGYLNKVNRVMGPFTADEAQRSRLGTGSTIADTMQGRQRQRPLEGAPGYSPGFLNPSAQSNPVEQATKNIALASEAARGGGLGAQLANSVQPQPVNMRVTPPEAQMPWSPIQLPPAAAMAVQPSTPPPSMPTPDSISALFPQNQPPQMPPPPPPMQQQATTETMPLSPFGSTPQNPNDLLQFLMNGMPGNLNWQDFNAPFTPG
jgi:hypothetical protein